MELKWQLCRNCDGLIVLTWWHDDIIPSYQQLHNVPWAVARKHITKTPGHAMLIVLSILKQPKERGLNQTQQWKEVVTQKDKTQKGKNTCWIPQIREQDYSTHPSSVHRNLWEAMIILDLLHGLRRSVSRCAPEAVLHTNSLFHLISCVSAKWLIRLLTYCSMRPSR